MQEFFIGQQVVIVNAHLSLYPELEGKVTEIIDKVSGCCPGQPYCYMVALVPGQYCNQRILRPYNPPEKDEGREMDKVIPWDQADPILQQFRRKETVS